MKLAKHSSSWSVNICPGNGGLSVSTPDSDNSHRGNRFMFNYFSGFSGFGSTETDDVIRISTGSNSVFGSIGVNSDVDIMAYFYGGGCFDVSDSPTDIMSYNAYFPSSNYPESVSGRNHITTECYLEPTVIAEGRLITGVPLMGGSGTVVASARYATSEHGVDIVLAANSEYYIKVVNKSGDGAGARAGSVYIQFDFSESPASFYNTDGLVPFDANTSDSLVTSCLVYDGTTTYPWGTGEPYPVSASDDDIFYILLPSADIDGIDVYVNTPAVHTSGNSIVWEYYNGSTWASLTVTDHTILSEGSFEKSGRINWTDTISEVTIALVEGYWIRARLNTASNMTTNPVLYGKPVLSPS